jgi:hypothetical protein
MNTGELNSRLGLEYRRCWRRGNSDLGGTHRDRLDLNLSSAHGAEVVFFATGTGPDGGGGSEEAGWLMRLGLAAD